MRASHRHRAATAAFACLAFAVSGCTSSGTNCGGGAGGAESTRVVSEYRLGSGDQLRVIVFGEENLSGEFVVDGSGSVSLPLIGELTARGHTLREFEESIEAQMRQGYIKDPRVSLEVLNFRPYYILGEVAQPGQYPYSEGLSVLNAVAVSGGFSYRANQCRVYIRRADGPEELSYVLSPKTPVQPGDTIRIPERIF